MIQNCVGLLELSSVDLERLGYTVADLGIITIRDILSHSFLLADLRVAECGCPCVFVIESQMNAAAIVQPFGSQVEVPSLDKQQHNIGPSRALPVRDEITITIPLSDSWFPYLGLAVTATLAPSQGNVHARAIYIRRT